MKKLLLFASALIMAVSFNACSEETDPENEKNPTENGDDNNDGDNEYGTSVTPTVLVSKAIVPTGYFVDGKEEFHTLTYKYDTLNRVVSCTDSWADKIYNVTYNGSTAKIMHYDVEWGHTINSSISMNVKGNMSKASVATDTSAEMKVTFKYDGDYISSYVADYTSDDEVYYLYYTWSKGNISKIQCDKTDDGKTFVYSTHTYEYDTSVELPVTSVDLFHLFDIFPFNFFEYELGNTMAAFPMSKQVKNPVKRVVCKNESGTQLVSEYSYSYNSDGTINSIRENQTMYDYDGYAESHVYHYSISYTQPTTNK